MKERKPRDAGKPPAAAPQEDRKTPEPKSSRRASKGAPEEGALEEVGRGPGRGPRRGSREGLEAVPEGFLEGPPEGSQRGGERGSRGGPRGHEGSQGGPGSGPGSTPEGSNRGRKGPKGSKPLVSKVEKGCPPSPNVTLLTRKDAAPRADTSQEVGFSGLGALVRARVLARGSSPCF